MVRENVESQRHECELAEHSGEKDGKQKGVRQMRQKSSRW